MSFHVLGKSAFWVTAALGLIWLGAGCRGSGGGSTTIVGLVLDETGQPFARATVTAGARSAASDSEGRYQVEVPAGGTTLLTVRGGSTGVWYRPITPLGAKTITVTTRLLNPSWSGTFDASQRRQLQTVAGLSLTFDAGSVRTASEETVAGNVAIAVTWVSQAAIAMQPPAPLATQDGQGTTPIIPHTLFDISLYYGGEPAFLKEGKTVRATWSAGSGAPPVSTLFTVDSATGLWRSEGSAYQSNGTWTADLPHLSWWSVGSLTPIAAADQACLRVVARDVTEQPIAGVQVTSATAGEVLFGTTGSDGALCSASVRHGQRVSLAWQVFLSPGATYPVTGSVTVTAEARGEQCGAEACQVVEIPVACARDHHCGEGETCKGGACVGASMTDGGPPAAEQAWASCRIDANTCVEYRGEPVDYDRAREYCAEAGGAFEQGTCPDQPEVGRCREDNASGIVQDTIYYSGDPIGLSLRCRVTPAGTWIPGT